MSDMLSEKMEVGEEIEELPTLEELPILEESPTLEELPKLEDFKKIFPKMRCMRYDEKECGKMGHKFVWTLWENEDGSKKVLRCGRCGKDVWCVNVKCDDEIE